MTLYPPLYQQADSYAANLDRQMLDFATRGRALRYAIADYAVTQRGAGANMSVDVAAGKAIIPGTDTAGQGSYLCWSDAVVNVPIAAAPPAGQSRIDLIVAQVRDSTVIGGANNDFVVAAVQGAAAATGTQVAPAAPPSSIVLAQVAVGPTVASIVNANITDTRPPSLFQPFNPYRAEMYRNAAYTQAAVGVATIPFDTIASDPAGVCTAGAGAKFTCPVAGMYTVTVCAFITPVSGTRYLVEAQQSGSVSLKRELQGVIPNGVAGIPVSGSTVFACAAGDTLQGVLNSGTTNTVFTVGQTSTWMTVELKSLT